MTESEILKRIFVSVTTYEGDWQKQVGEVKKLKLTEIGLFLTDAQKLERKKIYKALEQTSVKYIPHVHIRHDMSEAELDYLVNNYKSKVFTIHYQYIDSFKNSKYKKQIFVENNWRHSRIKRISRLLKVGGACIDLSHYEQFRLTDPKYLKMSQTAAKNFKVGCNHLSAVLKNGESWHKAKNFDELRYVADIPKKYFSKYICLELTNPISEQLKYKKQIAKLLAKTWTKKS